MYLMLSGEGAVQKQATGELHKHHNFPKHQAPPALPSYHRVGIDRRGRKHTNKKVQHEEKHGDNLYSSV